MGITICRQDYLGGGGIKRDINETTGKTGENYPTSKKITLAACSISTDSTKRKNG